MVQGKSCRIKIGDTMSPNQSRDPPAAKEILKIVLLGVRSRVNMFEVLSSVRKQTKNFILIHVF